MKSDDEVKKEFKLKAQQNPEKYYPVKTLKELGFERRKCAHCGHFFWSTKAQDSCGEPACSGGFRFIGNSPAKKKLSYIEAWKEYVRIHEKLGYTPVKRYPVVARWNPTTEFTIASIAAFQPYVVSGEIEPPANPLVIPQFCLRFPDIDNVGITGHYVGFVMLGEHAFVSPEEYDINKYLKDHITWLNEGMGLSNDDFVVHEDAWAGGGNFGPCVEFFSKGLEISNQVYMQYENTPEGPKELKIKVLDMGQGLERAAWFTQGTPTSYDAVFAPVLEKLTEATGVHIDLEFMKKFIPLSPYLNVQEVEDIEKAWEEVGTKLGINGEELQRKLLPIAGLYSVAEHSRALLVALADGALPSNVGGMYNLRVILRRALGFIDKFNWNVDICDVCDWHAKQLMPLFPELSKHKVNIRKILEVEKMKFRTTQEKTKQIVAKVVEKDLSTKDLIELYDSHGINPDMIKEEAARLGKKINVPKNFYALVAESHEKEAQVTATTKEEKVNIGDVADTKALYFEDWSLIESKGKVLKIVDNFVVLDQTVMYPTSGGQVHDNGEINGQKVVDIFKQGPNIIHKLEETPKFKEGDEVTCKVDFDRRKQLAQHHTSTHIINAAAKKVLGPHINQASAKKDTEKAYIDVTHYQTITEEEMEDIENEANKIVKAAVKTELKFYPRAEAEKQFGVDIYQGGAVPGKSLRIVNIPNIDVEACGGTHLNNTEEAEQIKILKITKIKDGVVRITFTAGVAAKRFIEKGEMEVEKLAGLLGVPNNQVPSRALELMEKWKKARKAVKKKQTIDLKELELVSKGMYEGNILEKTAEFLKTQPEHLEKTITRFQKELEEFKEKLKGA